MDRGIDRAIDREEAGVKLLEMMKKMLTSFMRKHNCYFLYDDLYSEGLLGITRAMKSYNPDKGASLTTYAYINIKGLWLDYVKNNTQRKALNLFGDCLSLDYSCNYKEGGDSRNEALFVESIQDNTDIERDYILKEMIEQLIEYPKLSNFQKEVLILLYVKGYTLDETAKILGKGYKNVNSTRCNAIEKLKQHFGGYKEVMAG